MMTQRTRKRAAKAWGGHLLLACTLLWTCTLPCAAGQNPLLNNFAAVLKSYRSQLEASGPAITLELAAGVFNVTETLAFDYRIASAPPSVTITGQGADSTILDCGGRVQALNIGNTASFTLQNMTIQNCMGAYETVDNLNAGGGAFILVAGNITIQGIAFRGNNASVNASTRGSGGALAFSSNRTSQATIRIADCLFDGNLGYWGGAIACVALDNTDVSIENCQFTANRADTAGGAVQFIRSKSQFMLQGNSWTNNTGRVGGALEWEDISSIKLSGDIFKGNRASQGGGALWAEQNGDAELSNVTITGSTAPIGGGLGFFYTSPASYIITNSTFIANTADATGTAGKGGHIYVLAQNPQQRSMALTMQNTTLRLGRAAVGSSVFLFDSVLNLTVSECIIQDGTSTTGGAVYADNVNGTLVIDKTLFQGNTAFNGQGGGLFLDGGLAVTQLTNSRFEGNLASQCGAAQATSLSQPILVVNTTFSGNSKQASATDGSCLNAIDAWPPPTPPPPAPAPSPQPNVPAAAATPSENSPSIIWASPYPASFAYKPPSDTLPRFTGPQTDNSPAPSRSVPVAAIAGGVAGGVVILALLAVVALLLRKNRRLQKQQQETVSTTPFDAGQGGERYAPTSDKRPLTSGSPGSSGDSASGSVVVQVGPSCDRGYSGSSSTPSGKKPMSPAPSYDPHEPPVKWGTSGASAASTPSGNKPMSPSVYSKAMSPSSSVDPHEPPVKPWAAASSSTASSGSLVLGTRHSAGLSSASSQSVYQKEMLSRLQIPWSSIQIVRVLGQGGHGTVYRGVWQGNKVAVRTLDVHTISDTAFDSLRREALAMCEIRHPCIAHIYGLVDDGERCALVMKYYRHGSLAAAINKTEYSSLDAVQRLTLALQVASGMSALHSRNMIHGDLKCSNLLFENDGRSIVITDFGLSARTGESVASGAPSVHISPPEVLRDPSAPRTQAGDVYAFAIVMLEILSGRPAYQGLNPKTIHTMVMFGDRPAIPPSEPPEVVELLDSCWQANADARPTFTEVVQRLEAIRSQRMGTAPGHGQGEDIVTTTAVIEAGARPCWAQSQRY